MNTEDRGEVFLPVRSSRRRNALWIASVALVYFVTARPSLLLEFQPEGIAAIWPPEGIFLSALLLTRRGVRGYLAGTLCIADLAAERLAGTPWVVAALYALALTGNAVLSSWLLRRFLGGAPTFTKVRDVFGFLALAVVFSNSLWSLLAAAASELLPGTSSFWGSWTWWAASDGVGNLLVTPLLLSWASWAASRSRPGGPKRLLEGAALFVPLALLNFLAFRHRGAAGPLSLLLPYVTFPFLWWAAVRFGVRGVTSALVIIAAIAVSFVAAAPVPGFPFDGSRLSGVIVAQLYLAILAVPSLLLVAAVTERTRAAEVLQFTQFAVDHTADAAFWMTEDARFFYVNEAACQALGYSRAELLERTVFDIDPAFTEDMWRKSWRRLKAEKSIILETVHQARNGRVYPVEVRANYLEFGGRAYDCAFARDITERKRAEETLREKEYLLSESQRIGRIGTWSVDLATDAVTWTRETYRLYGVSSDTFVPSADALLGLLHPDDRASMRESMRAMRAGEHPGVLEFRAILPDGSVRVLSGRGELLSADGHRPVRLVGTVQDITEQKQAQAALQESEQRYRILLEHGFDGIFVHEDFRIVQLNDRLAEMTGCARSDLLGRKLIDMFTPDSQERIRQYARSGAAGYIELELRRPDGRSVAVESFGAFCQFQGRPARIVGLRDITERKQAEEALRESNATLEANVAQRTEDLRQTVRQLRELTLELSQAEDRERKRIADILHEDVQQTLAAAKFHLNLLTSEPRSAEESREIVDQVNQMLKDAIERSRRLSHELSPALYQVDLTAILEWLARQMQQKHGLTVHVEAHGPVDSPSEPVKAFLYKVAQELLFNVVKHAGVSEARIRVRRLGSCLYLSVADQGRGFDPQGLEGAAGFGLLSIRERVQLLGGRMKIRSMPGRGSRILIAVPDQETSGAPLP